MQVTYRQLRVFGKVLTFSMVTGVLSVALVVGVEEREACRQLADRTDSWYYPDPCSVVYSGGTTRNNRGGPMNTTHTPEQDLIAAVEQAMPAGTRLGLTDTAHSTVYLHENNRPDRLVTVYLLSRARIAEVFVVNDADRHSVHTPEEIRFDTIAELAEQVADILTRHDREDPTR